MATICDLDEDLGTLGAKVGTRLETGQDELRTKLDLVQAGVGAIHTLLIGLAEDDAAEDDEVSANPGGGDPGELP